MATERLALVLGAHDEERRRGLRRMRTVATSLLVLAAVVFIATHGHGGGWGYVNATSEAAMVGALADWFAVTAIFRHPLGLPIPHTALIPQRKAALGQSLEEFVAANFLSAPIVRERILAAHLSLRIGGWLLDPAHSTRVVNEAAALVRAGLTALDDDEVVSLVAELVLPRLLEEPISPIAGALLEGVVEEGAHHALVDLLLEEAQVWLSDNEAVVLDILAARAPWWTPQWVDEAVTQRVYREALAWVADVRKNPEHPVRIAVDDLLAQLADDLQHDPETMAKAEALKNRLLTHPSTGATALDLWHALRRGLVAAIDEPEGLLRQRGIRALQQTGERLVADEPLRKRLDGYAADVAGYVVTSFGAEIATVISDTVNRWDGPEAARRIELHVGRDLQFIRINGTVVGGLAGLVIYSLAQLL